jgi:hypothetical protein
VFTQQLTYRSLNIGVWMDGQNHHYPCLMLDNLADRGTDRFELAAPVLAAVCCHEDQSATIQVGFLKATAM